MRTHPIIAIYPGTFDPITNGHSDLIVRAARMFDQVIVAVAANFGKAPAFALEKRVELASAVLADYHNVAVRGFDTLLVEFARMHGATIILRGLRAMSDFEHEFQLAGINRKLAPHIETAFLMPAEQYTYLSSSLVREIATLGGPVSDFVHPRVEAALREQRS